MRHVDDRGLDMFKQKVLKISLPSLSALHKAYATSKCAQMLGNAYHAFQEDDEINGQVRFRNIAVVCTVCPCCVLSCCADGHTMLEQLPSNYLYTLFWCKQVLGAVF